MQAPQPPPGAVLDQQVGRLELEALKLCRTSNKINMLYKFVGGLFGTKPREGTHVFTQNPAHGFLSPIPKHNKVVTDNLKYIKYFFNNHPRCLHQHK